MSGSDPTSHNGGTRGAGGSCPDDLELTLGSPDPEAIADLEIGYVLDVLSIEEPVRGVAAFDVSGRYVGAVTRDLVDLRSCLEQGVLYEAEVLNIRGGAITVVVRQR